MSFEDPEMIFTVRYGPSSESVREITGKMFENRRRNVYLGTQEASKDKALTSSVTVLG